MAKKKNQIPFYLSVASIALAAIAIVMIFLPAIVAEEMDTTYTGLQVVFGYSDKIVGQEVDVWKFSFMNFLTYAALIAGLVLSVLNLKGGNKLFGLIATACFVVAAVFFFSTVGFTVPASDYIDSEDLKEFFTLGAGPIIGAICSILAAGASGYNLVKGK